MRVVVDPASSAAPDVEKTLRSTRQAPSYFLTNAPVRLLLMPALLSLKRYL